MAGLPTVTVELDDGTNTFPHDITAYVRLTDGYNFSRGRDDEQSAVTAGTLNLSLNNADGRFTPGDTAIASPSPITVDQKIRLRETVNGTTYTRFTGYVKAWPVSWPAVVDTHSVVTITASDAQARAERRTLRSVVEEEILADDPVAYFMLNEPVDSVNAADSSGNATSPLVIAGTGGALAFGATGGVSTGGPETGVSFTGNLTSGQYLTQSASTGSALGSVTVECWFTTTTPTNAQTIATVGWPTDSGSTFALGTSLGKLIVPQSGFITSAATVSDGALHYGAFTYDTTTGTLTLYLDGVSQGTFAMSAGITFARRLSVGAADDAGGASPFFAGTVWHAALTEGVLSAARIAAHYQAGLTGFDGESVQDRYFRLLGYAGLTGSMTGSTDTTLSFRDFTGSSAWSAIQDVADAEGGLAYVTGSGTPALQTRDLAPEKTAPDVTIAASFVTADAQPTEDDQQIINYFETTAQGTELAQVVSDAASEDAHGRYSDSKTYLVSTDAEALDRANWIIGNYAEPFPRFGSLTVNLYGMTAAQQEAAVDNLEPGAWLRVTSMPDQTPGGGASVDLMVQGINVAQSASAWTITCNVVSRSLFEALILDDATYGVLDDARLYF